MTIIAGIGVFVGSYFATNAILDFASQPSEAPPAGNNQGDGIEALKTALIYDERSLQNAALAAKLRSSESLRGVIDGVQRMPDGRVVAAGWAVDTRGNGAPVTILAFAKGKQVLEGETAGERPDVTAALHLPPHLARNTKIDLTVPCNSGEALVIAFATRTNAYAPGKVSTCP